MHINSRNIQYIKAKPALTLSLRQIKKKEAWAGDEEPALR